MNKLPLKAQLVYTWMIPFLDDYGCYTADPEDIKTEVFPKNNRVSKAGIRDSLNELQTVNLIVIYEVNGNFYQKYNNFDSFQTFKTDRAKKHEYPERKGGLETNGNQRKPVVSPIKVKLIKVNLTKAVEYSGEFENFWKIFKGRWNTDKGRYDKGSKLEAWEVWQEMIDADKALALKGAPKTGDKKTKDCCRWLKFRCWET